MKQTIEVESKTRDKHWDGGEKINALNAIDEHIVIKTNASRIDIAELYLSESVHIKHWKQYIYFLDSLTLKIWKKCVTNFINVFDIILKKMRNMDT